VPTKLKLPTLSYKGDSDPTDHTEAFESYMSVWEQPDEVWCRVFPTTLHGLAQSWYKGLPDGSVYCYADLRDNFLAQYSCNKRRAVETADLLTMKQGGDESLRSYIKRFDAKVQQVRDLNGQLAAFALMKGLPPGELKDDLIKKERLTLDLARQMADQAIKVEDYHKTWVGHHEGRRSDVRSRLGPDNYEQGRRDKSRSRSERNNKRQHSAGSGGSSAAYHQNRYASHTPLVASPSEVFAMSKGDGQKWAKPPSREEMATRASTVSITAAPGIRPTTVGT